jgi:hypothetical protein
MKEQPAKQRLGCRLRGDRVLPGNKSSVGDDEAPPVRCLLVEPMMAQAKQRLYCTAFELPLWLTFTHPDARLTVSLRLQVLNS